MSEVERWLPVVGFPGYEVSDIGNVRAWGGNSRNKPKRAEPLLLKLQTSALGYRRIALSFSGRTALASVHRLVLEAFAGPCPDGMEACHNNGIRYDNRLANLRWDTRKNNHADKHAHGTAQYGSANGCARLSESDVVELRTLRERGAKHAELAARYGVSDANIASICRGESWVRAGGSIQLGTRRSQNV